MAMEVERSTDDLQFPFWKSVRKRFDPDSTFFSLGNIERELLAKQVIAINKEASSNSFMSILNGVGVFGTGILGALYAMLQKDKEAAEATIESWG